MILKYEITKNREIENIAPEPSVPSNTLNKF